MQTIKTKKIIAGIVGGAATFMAPIIPSNMSASVWYVHEDGCFKKIQIEEKIIEQEMSCDEYWTIANTPNYPQPEVRILRAIISPKISIAAIAKDTSSNSGSQSLVSSISWSHTVTTGSDIVLIAAVTTQDSSATDGVTNIIKYNGVDMASTTSASGGSASTFRVYLFHLANPSTGANTLAVTLNDTTTSTLAGAVAFTGAKTSNPIDNSATEAAATGNPDTTVVTNNANSYIFGAMINDEPNATKTGCGDTQEWEVNITGEFSVGCSKTTTAAGSYTVAFQSTDLDEDYVTAITAVNELVAASGGKVTTQDIIFFE